MASLNTPAGRLFHVIHGLRNAAANDQNRLLFDAWAEFFRIEKTNMHRLLSKIGLALELPTQVESEMNRLLAEQENDPISLSSQTYLSWLPDVKGACTEVNFGVKASHFLRRFDGNVLSLIEICDHQLLRFRAEPAVNDAALRNLQERLEELRAQINEVELQEKIRSYVLYHIALIDEAIADQRIIGIEAFARAAKAAVGDALLRRDLFEQTKKSPVGERLSGLIANLVMFWLLCGSYSGAKEMVSDSCHLLFGDQLPQLESTIIEVPPLPEDRTDEVRKAIEATTQ